MTNHTAKTTKTRSMFRMACAVEITVQAKPEAIWALLTDARGFASWNSTVTSIEGDIAPGGSLKIKVPASPSRVFKAKVSGVEPARAMTWSDGAAPFFRGVRTFRLTPNANGSTDFAMREAFAGLMLPLIKGALPDFGPIFATYAEDLKRVAEAR
jgi:hypothetical protein